jgi:hypothetical protein
MGGQQGLWEQTALSEPPRLLVSGPVVAAALGADGRTVYYATGGRDAGLFSTTREGAPPVRLATGNINALVASGNGTLGYIQRSDGGYQIWAVAEHSAPQLIAPGAFDAAPLLSPDLRQVAVMRAGVASVCELPRCEAVKRIPVGSRVLGWTPDGLGLTFAGAPDEANVWIAGLADGSMRQVTRFTNFRVTSVVWSSTGGRFAVSRQRTLSDLEMFGFGSVGWLRFSRQPGGQR